jgi:hypothetical protein
MRKFARVDAGVVMEMFPPDDHPKDLLPEDGNIRSLFHPDIVWVKATSHQPLPMEGWLYADGTFSEPKPYPPSPDEVLAENKAIRDAMLDAATRLINPLVDALDAGSATDKERDNLLVLKRFRIDTNRVDLTQINPAWPEFPG